MQLLAPFLASVNSHASLLNFAPLHGPSLQCVLHYIADSPLRPALPSTGSCYPSVSVPRSHRRCRNLNLLSIAYDHRPRLRSRLTLGGRTFPRKPWAFDVCVSRTHLVTHTGILSTASSTSPSGLASANALCSSTAAVSCNPKLRWCVLAPDIFGAQSLDQ